MPTRPMPQKCDCNPKNALGKSEREMLLMITGFQERLDYPTEKLSMSNGCEVERYLIPETDKPKVLQALYPFVNPPSMKAEMTDLHTGKSFQVKDFLVVREGDGNFLVTPFYAEAGGTVLDWLPPENSISGDYCATIKNDLAPILGQEGQNDCSSCPFPKAKDSPES